MSATRKLSFVAVVAMVGVLAAGWFLLVSPRRGEAADLEAKKLRQDQANVQLTNQIKQLQAQQADLPKERAKLATFRTQIPQDPALPSLVRQLTAAGRQTGVSIDELSPSTPLAAVVTGSPTAPVTTGTTAPAAGGSLYQVPLTLNLTGSYFELEQFVNRLEGLKRSFLVTGFTLGDATSEGALDGDLGLSLQGRVFLSAPATATATTAPQPVAATVTDATSE